MCRLGINLIHMYVLTMKHLFMEWIYKIRIGDWKFSISCHTTSMTIKYRLILFFFPICALVSSYIYVDALLWMAFKLSHWHCQSFCPSNLLSKLLATIYLHAIWTREWSIVIVRFKKVKRGWGWYKYHDEVCVCHEKSSPLDQCVLLFSCPALSSLEIG